MPSFLDKVRSYSFVVLLPPWVLGTYQTCCWALTFVIPPLTLNVFLIYTKCLHDLRNLPLEGSFTADPWLLLEVINDFGLSCPCPRSTGYFLRGQLLRKGLWTEGISSCQSMVPHWLAWPMGMSWRFCTRHSCTKMSSWSSRKEMTSPGPPPCRSHTQPTGGARCPERPSPWSLEWEWVRHPLTSQQGMSSIDSGWTQRKIMAITLLVGSEKLNVVKSSVCGCF